MRSKLFITVAVFLPLCIFGNNENSINNKEGITHEEELSNNTSLLPSTPLSINGAVQTTEPCTNINTTLANDNEVLTNKTSKPTKVNCKSRVITADTDAIVRIANSSVMLNVVVPESNITANECALVLFYGTWCHFSAMAAPHFNALARLYPTFHLFAVNAIKYNSLNARYGIVAVPSLLLFHNGRAIAKFNETVYSLDNFVYFVGKYTNTPAQGAVNVTSADFYGPLPSEPSFEHDYILWLAWIFIFLCAATAFVKSSLCRKLVEIIRNNWREAEAQHEHED